MGIGGAGDIKVQPAMFGSGTQSDPWRIVSKKEIIYVSGQVAAGKTFAGQYLKVMKNIDMSVAGDFKPIGTSLTALATGTGIA